MSQAADTLRARYGLIIPSSNRMAEPHAWRYTPPVQRCSFRPVFIRSSITFWRRYVC